MKHKPIVITALAAMALSIQGAMGQSSEQAQNLLTNPDFSDYGGWNGGYYRGNQGSPFAYNNYYSWDCYQELQGLETGLYKLEANACGLYSFYYLEDAVLYKDTPLPIELYFGDQSLTLPSAFSEVSDENIYGSYNVWEYDGGYVCRDVYAIGQAFAKDMFKNEMWVFYDAAENNSVKVGVKCTVEYYTELWGAWTNMSLTQVTEEILDQFCSSLIEEAEGSLDHPQYKEQRDELIQIIDKIKDCTDYREKSELYIAAKKLWEKVEESIALYENLNEAIEQLKEAIDNASADVDAEVLTKAKDVLAKAEAAYAEGSYDNAHVDEAVTEVKAMVEYLGFKTVVVDVVIPGTLGDLILEQVENFSDVQILKVSGTLNSKDIYNIENRLTDLRVVDMSALNMTELPNNLFYMRSLLQSVKLPAKLQSIGAGAFYECNILNTVEFPATLQSIGDDAFRECDNIREVILPEGLCSLGQNAFYGLDRNQRVKLPSTLTALAENAFYYNPALECVEFSEGLVTINRQAFHRCTTLDNVVLPSTVTTIEFGAFANDDALSTIVLNEGISTIGDKAFSYCTSLKEITLPSTLVMAAYTPFSYCSSLKDVTSLAFEPPYITTQFNSGCSMDDCTLYVPQIATNNYKQTDYWDQFPSIIGIDYMPETIVIHNETFISTNKYVSDFHPNLYLIKQSIDYGITEYGQLSVAGDGTLNLRKFETYWNPYGKGIYWLTDAIVTYASLINYTEITAEEVSVRVDTPAWRWTFMSLPFDANLADIETVLDGATSYAIRTYDCQKRAEGELDQTWVKLEAEDIIPAGQGFIIQASRYADGYNQDYSGFRFHAIDNPALQNIFISNNATVTLKEYPSEKAENCNWNFLGNPYPCYFDTRFLDFTAPITIWNPIYSIYGAISPIDDDYVLDPGEAFFVQKPSAVDAIVFDAEGRQMTNVARTLEVPTKVYGNNKAERTIFNFIISGQECQDQTRLVINDLASVGYEPERDAAKFMSPVEASAQMWTVAAEVAYAINERPLVDGVIDLAINIGEEGNYQIYLKDEIEGWIVEIEDLLEGSIEELTATHSYSFTSKATKAENRFRLHIYRIGLGISSVESDCHSDDDAIYTISGIKVENPTAPGVYIKNNKKVIIK
ncbi:MAG: leucine-rich repeat protein [Bacteroidales bacterium]|nr:leucine-rich repeat protein [Bacteroidales bacterium]